MDTLTFLNYNV